jgi:hypothetical protein
MKLVTQASQRIAERLTWCTASRDQAGIANDLAEGKEISEVYGLGEAGLFDELFYFLEEMRIMDFFMGLDPGKTQRTSNVNFPAVILIHLMRIVAGLRFFRHIDSVILTSQSLMRLVGFNGRQIHGPYCPDSIASHVQTIAANVLERLFNGVVSVMAARSIFPNKIMRPGRNNAAAFRSHVYLTLLVMALTTAFQTWMDQQDKLAQKGHDTGIRRFREKVRQENGNKLIVFDGER